ncbi:hypothetical protein LTR66_016736, partial [Elasticomyces elasticus]
RRATASSSISGDTVTTTTRYTCSSAARPSRATWPALSISPTRARPSVCRWTSSTSTSGRRCRPRRWIWDPALLRAR